MINRLGLAGVVLAGAFFLISIPNFILYKKSKAELREEPSIEKLEKSENYRKTGFGNVAGGLVMGAIAYIEFRYPTKRKE